MGKKKPRWKDLEMNERLLRRAEQRGDSEFVLDFWRERAERAKQEESIYERC